MTETYDIRPEEQYQRYLNEGRFMILRARKSGKYIFYPRVTEPLTGSTDLEWVAASGAGTVYSVTIVRKKPEQGGVYNVVLVDLEEGPRMMSRVEGISNEEIKIGMTVKAKVIKHDGNGLVVFEPA